MNLATDFFENSSYTDQHLELHFPKYSLNTTSSTTSLTSTPALESTIELTKL